MSGAREKVKFGMRVTLNGSGRLVVDGVEQLRLAAQIGPQGQIEGFKARIRKDTRGELVGGMDGNNTIATKQFLAGEEFDEEISRGQREAAARFDEAMDIA